MQFQHEGRKFAIEFSRAKRAVEFYSKGKSSLMESKYPYTTVTIIELKEDGATVFATASAGCNPKFDRFTPKDGRLWALKKITKEIPRDMQQPMWDCYNARAEQPAKAPTGSGSASTSMYPIVPMLAMDIETPVMSRMIN